MDSKAPLALMIVPPAEPALVAASITYSAFSFFNNYRYQIIHRIPSLPLSPFKLSNLQLLALSTAQISALKANTMTGLCKFELFIK